MVVRRIAVSRRVAAVDTQIRVVRIRDLDFVVRRRIAETRIAAVDLCACDVICRRVDVLEAVHFGCNIRRQRPCGEKHRRRCRNVVLEITDRSCFCRIIIKNDIRARIGMH